MTAIPTTTARYATVCRGCFNPIFVGDVIVKLDAGWCCADCARPDRTLEWEQLFSACPPHHLQRIYRALAVAFHPDAGGDTKTMTAINVAYQKYERSR